MVHRSPKSGSGGGNRESVSTRNMGGTYKITGVKDNSSSCGGCEEVVEEKDRGVQCDICMKWFHVKCGKVGNDVYKAIGTTGGIDWFCPPCKKLAKDSRESVMQLTDENKKLKEENKILKERLAVIENKMQEIKEEIKQEVISEVNSFKVILDEMKEKEDKKMRECNLVLYQVKESNKVNGKDREADDRSACEKIFKEGIGEEDFQIKSIYRLGRKIENERNSSSKPRPLLVRLENSDQKWQILRNAKKLGRSTSDMKKCIVAPDLTIKEREADRKLRGELKERRDRGEEGWVIRSGKLIKRNF